MTEVGTASVPAVLLNKGVMPRGGGTGSSGDFADALQGGSGSIAGKEIVPANAEANSWTDLMAKLSAVLHGATGLAGEEAGAMHLSDAQHGQGEVEPVDTMVLPEVSDPANPAEEVEVAVQQPDAQADAVLSSVPLPPGEAEAIVPGQVFGMEDGASPAGEEALIRSPLLQEAGKQPATRPAGGPSIFIARDEVPAKPSGVLSAENDPNPLEPARQARNAVQSGNIVTEQPSDISKPATAPAQQGAPKITVLGTQNIPAPLAADTASRFIQDLTSSSGLVTTAPARASEVHDHAQPRQTTLQTLKIQLHPAELGTVTANLRLAGEQMQVELRVESAEAYHRLSKDAELIVKAFRTMGYDIDQVTVQQSSSSQTSQRPDGGAGGSQGFFQESGSSHAGTSRNGGRGGANGEFESEMIGAERPDGEMSPHESRSARDLYI